MINYKNRSFTYRYSIFGMTAASDIMLPQLVETVGEPDIYIIEGEVPKEIDAVKSKNEFIQVSGNELLFTVKGVGRYYISNGKCVVVEPESEGKKQLVQLYLLGSAMGALLFQRGILPIHGSAVVIEDRAFIITGESGAGKSSLTLAFREMGYPFLTDDIAALTQDKNGYIYVQPAYPQQKLWKDCIEAMGEEAGALTQINSSKDKYYYPAYRGFCDSPVRLAAVCEMIPQECGKAELKVVNGVEKIDVLMRNIYRYQLAGFFESGQAYFKKCGDIASNVNVFKLFRPVGRFTVNEQAELLLGQLI